MQLSGTRVHYISDIVSVDLLWVYNYCNCLSLLLLINIVNQIYTFKQTQSQQIKLLSVRRRRRWQRRKTKNQHQPNEFVLQSIRMGNRKPTGCWLVWWFVWNGLLVRQIPWWWAWVWYYAVCRRYIQERERNVRKVQAQTGFFFQTKVIGVYSCW